MESSDPAKQCRAATALDAAESMLGTEAKGMRGAYGPQARASIAEVRGPLCPHTLRLASAELMMPTAKSTTRSYTLDLLADCLDSVHR